MIKLRNVTKSFSGKKVLDGFSLELEEGGRLLISAPSGRGKTTLLAIMMGLTLPDSGSVSGVPQRIAAVFQEDRLPDDLTPVACVRMTAARSVTRERIIKELAGLGLSDCAEQKVRTLSGGQKRRVAVVRALICDFDILFLDEPFTGLDTETKKCVCEYINRHTQGKTLVCVSHGEDDAKLLNCKSLRI